MKRKFLVVRKHDGYNTQDISYLLKTTVNDEVNYTLKTWGSDWTESQSNVTRITLKDDGDFVTIHPDGKEIVLDFSEVEELYIVLHAYMKRQTTKIKFKELLS